MGLEPFPKPASRYRGNLMLSVGLLHVVNGVLELRMRLNLVST